MANYCSECGSKLKGNARFCEKCGTKVGKGETETNVFEFQTQNDSTISKLQEYNQGAGGKVKKNKGCFMVILVLFLLGAVFSFLDSPFEPGTNSDNAIKENIFSNEGISGEQSDAIMAILKECGVTNIKVVKHDELLDGAHFEGEKGFRISTDDGVNNIILYLNQDGSVYQIRWADKNLYAEGELIATLNNYLMTNSEISDYQYRAQEKVKSILKSPSTAKFPNILEWTIWKEDGIVIVQSYVDSENAFGAMIRAEFQIKSKDDSMISFLLMERS